jgi:hypothetical protein
MSMRSLTGFIEASPRSVRRLASTATVTGRGNPQVDGSVGGLKGSLQFLGKWMTLI